MKTKFTPAMMLLALATPVNVQAQDSELAPGEIIMPPPVEEWSQLPESSFRIDPSLVGDYQLGGVMETGSGLRLKPDGTFEWFFIVGALDVFAKGKWSATDDVLRLVNEPAKFQAQPYRIGDKLTWESASEEAKAVGTNTAPPPCYHGDEALDRGKPIALDQAVVFQIGFSIESLPPLRSGGKRTKPYPLYLCSTVTMIGADGTEYHYDSNDGGYVLARMPDGSQPRKIIIENRTRAGLNIEDMEVTLPSLTPGLYPLLLDYRRFEARMFDSLYLEKTDKGFAPYFGGQPSEGAYVKVERDKDDTGQKPTG